MLKENQITIAETEVPRQNTMLKNSSHNCRNRSTTTTKHNTKHTTKHTTKHNTKHTGPEEFETRVYQHDGRFTSVASALAAGPCIRTEDTWFFVKSMWPLAKSHGCWERKSLVSAYRKQVQKYRNSIIIGHSVF